MGRKSNWLKTLCLMSLVFMCINVVIPAVMHASPAAGGDSGSAVPFDSTGRFKDTLDTLDNLFGHAGINHANGGVTGPGDMYYFAGSSDFNAATIDVTVNKWSLNFTTADDLKVFETVYDSSSGTYIDGREIHLVRKLRPDWLTDRNYLKETYATGPISPNTKYLHIKLPQASYFSDSGSYGSFVIDTITLSSSKSAAKSYESIVDSFSGFTHLVEGSDTSNLNKVDLSNESSIWDARTFGNRSFVERFDATKEDHALTYRAPAGKELKSVYAEGFFNFLPSQYFEVWTSADGVTYSKATQSSSYHMPSIPYDSNWLPVSIDISSLPAGTSFVQIRMPAFTQDELYGMKHPRMTKAAIGYGDPADGSGDPGESTPGKTTITKTTNPISINGSIEMGDNGKPTGEWQGAHAITIAGMTDANDDYHGAKIYFRYDYDNLYVGALIQDPTPMINESTGNGIWNGDNLELFIGTEDLDYTSNPDKKNTMLPSDVQVVLSGSISNGAQSYVYTNSAFSYPNISLAAKKSADGQGYTMEAAIPLSELGITSPWDHKKILLNAVLNDGSASGRGQWGWTTNGETVKKSRGQWGSADLEAASAPSLDITAQVEISPTNLITVSGQALGVHGKDITLLVTDPNGITAYIDQAPSDEQGNYSFTFPIVGSNYGSGTYSAMVGGDGVGRPIRVTFEFTPRDPEPESSGEPISSLSGPSHALRGSEIQLKAGVSGGSHTFNMMQAVLHYDKDKLEFSLDPADNNRLAAGVVTALIPHLNVLDAAIKPDKGEILVLLGSTNGGIEAQGELFAVKTKVKVDAGVGPLTVSLSDFQLSNEAALITAGGSAMNIQITATDQSALIDAIAAAQIKYDAAAVGSAPGQYPASAKEALHTAIANAKAVADNGNASQTDIDAAASALSQAVTTFLNAVNSAVQADKAALNQAIIAAQSKYDNAKEGSKVGQYPSAARTTLLNAIQHAKQVRDASSSNQSQVDQETASLNSALQTFKGQLVALVPGAAQITIQDLSILAKYFGKTSAEPNWSDIVKADIFDEGEITIRALAAIAQLIVNDWLTSQ